MRLSGRRESSNVEDRRGMSTGAKAGIGGIGAVIVAALFAWISGGDPMQAGLQAFQEQMLEAFKESEEYVALSNEEKAEALAAFMKSAAAGRPCAAEVETALREENRLFRYSDANDRYHDIMVGPNWEIVSKKDF